MSDEQIKVTATRKWLRRAHGKTIKRREVVDADVADELLRALAEILAHVEDLDIERSPPSQCKLCHTYRMIGHNAIARAREVPHGQ